MLHQKHGGANRHVEPAATEDHVAEDSGPIAVSILGRIFCEQPVNAEVAQPLQNKPQKTQQRRNENAAVGGARIRRIHPQNARQRFILYAPAQNQIADQRQKRAKQPKTEQVLNARPVQLAGNPDVVEILHGFQPFRSSLSRRRQRPAFFL